MKNFQICLLISEALVPNLIPVESEDMSQV